MRQRCAAESSEAEATSPEGVAPVWRANVVYRTFRFVGIEGMLRTSMLLGESVWRRTYVPAVPDDSFPSTSAVALKDRATPRPRYHVLAVYAQANLLQIRPGIWASGGFLRRLGASSWYV